MTLVHILMNIQLDTHICKLGKNFWQGRLEAEIGTAGPVSLGGLTQSD